MASPRFPLTRFCAFSVELSVPCRELCLRLPQPSWQSLVSPFWSLSTKPRNAVVATLPFTKHWSRPREVAALVFTEGLLLTGGGILVGLLWDMAGLALSVGPFRETTGLVLNPWQIPSSELVALGVMAGCGAIASLFPSVSCYRRTPIEDLHLTE